MKSMNRALVGAVALVSSLSLTACLAQQDAYHRQDQTTSAVNNAGIGAAIGAAAAGVATAGTGAALGAAAGGALAGGTVGYSWDKDEAVIRDKLTASGVSVIEVGYSNDIVLLMPSDIHFASGSAELSPHFKQILDSVAEVMKAYSYTVADIPGHADSNGSVAYNQRLSMARAQSVADFLAAQGISSNRLIPQGYSELRPVASNDTAKGRMLNRRVQIVLHAPPIR